MEEELIEAVRSIKCLYDVKDPDYVKVKLKESIWKRIAEDLKLGNGNDAKKTWEKLRNNHRDALRRQKNVKPRSGSGAFNIRPWRFQDNMAFLIPHITNRLTKPNMREDTNNEELSQVDSDSTQNDIQENLMDNQEFLTGNEKLNRSYELSSHAMSPEQAKKRRRHKRKTLNNELLNRSSDEQRVENKQQKREPSMTITTHDYTRNDVKNDSLFHFFMSMYETTKTLPPLSQHTIKTNLFSLVLEEESKNFIQLSSRPPSSNSHLSDSGSYYSPYSPSSTQVKYQSNDSIPAERNAPQIIITRENKELHLEEVNCSGSDLVYKKEPIN